MYNYKEVDDILVAGSTKFLRNDSIAACDLWLEAWEKIKQIMDTESLIDINDVDDLYNWCELMGNFVQDLEHELYNAGIDEPLYYSKKIIFCQEVLKRTKDENLIKEMRRAIAETRFSLGEQEEASKDFESIIQDFPNWSWSYLDWANCHVILTKPPNYDKAIPLLERALENVDAEGFSDICEVAKGYFDNMDDELKTSSHAASLQHIAGLDKSIDFHPAKQNIREYSKNLAENEAYRTRVNLERKGAE